ncbi:MAG: DUF6132 family protein, partial [Bacteroidota bacterium]
MLESIPPFIRSLIPIALGAAGGYAYYRFIGCKSGMCPITSNPWLSMLYGA